MNPAPTDIDLEPVLKRPNLARFPLNTMKDQFWFIIPIQINYGWYTV